MKQVGYSVDMDREYLRYVGSLESGKIMNLADGVDDIADWLANGMQVEGDPLPWEKIGDAMKFRRGELTLWGGYNGHGKSGLLGQVLAYWSGELGIPVAVMSFEMSFRSLVLRHVRQVLGRNPNSQAEGLQALIPVNEKYWVYDEKQRITPEKVLGAAVWLATEKGCRHIVVDSLVKCAVPRTPDHSENLTRFVSDLQEVAKQCQTHVHLVVHLRKGEGGEKRIPDKHDIKYAGELSDLADNAILIWRNKPKEDDPAMCRDEFDTGLIVAKQRHHCDERKWGLWFDPLSESWRGTE